MQYTKGQHVRRKIEYQDRVAWAHESKIFIVEKYDENSGLLYLHHADTNEYCGRFDDFKFETVLSLNEVAEYFKICTLSELLELEAIIQIQYEKRANHEK